MKIWYQSYSPMGYDPKWKGYEETLKRCAREAARPGTQVDIFGVQTMAARMVESDYIQYLHVRQVIEKGVEAERAGYDAFIVGGTLDPGQVIIRELLDIPVAFIGESSYYAACLLAPKFSVIAPAAGLLHRQTRLIENYGLASRFVPGAHMNCGSLVELLNDMDNNPKAVIELIRKTAAGPIERGAAALVPGFGAITSFLSAQGVEDVDGIPIIDGVTVVIRTAEMLVDLRKKGVKRAKKGYDISPVSKAELMAARKQYGVE